MKTNKITKIKWDYIDLINGHDLNHILNIPINLQKIPNQILISCSIGDDINSIPRDTVYIIDSKYHSSKVSTIFTVNQLYIFIEEITKTNIKLKIKNTITNTQSITFKEIIAIE